jgi:hypothetical protein
MAPCRGLSPEVFEIDVGAATTRQDLHTLLAEAFHFPEFDGNTATSSLVQSAAHCFVKLGVGKF